MAAALLLVTLGAGAEAERYTTPLQLITCVFTPSAIRLATCSLVGATGANCPATTVSAI